MQAQGIPWRSLHQLVQESMQAGLESAVVTFIVTPKMRCTSCLRPREQQCHQGLSPGPRQARRDPAAVQAPCLAPGAPGTQWRTWTEEGRRTPIPLAPGPQAAAAAAAERAAALPRPASTGDAQLQQYLGPPPTWSSPWIQAQERTTGQDPRTLHTLQGNRRSRAMR